MDASLLGFDIRNVSLREAVAELMDLIRLDGQAHVSFLNAHYVNVAAKDQEYREALRGADLLFADGSGMRLAGRLAGVRLCDNVNGTDLFPLLAQAMAREGMRVFLLGGRPGVAEDVRSWLNRTFPGLVVCGVRDGFAPADHFDAVAEQICSPRPHLLLVAMGSPTQDVWIRRYLLRGQVPVTMAVGGLFDFYAGRVPRAPRWVRRLGLEWVFRLAQEPKRLWRRYLVGNARFLVRAAALALWGRGREAHR